MPRQLHPIWAYYNCIKKEGNVGKWAQCKKCSKEFQGIPDRMREHYGECKKSSLTSKSSTSKVVSRKSGRRSGMSEIEVSKENEDLQETQKVDVSLDEGNEESLLETSDNNEATQAVEDGILDESAQNNEINEKDNELSIADDESPKETTEPVESTGESSTTPSAEVVTRKRAASLTNSEEAPKAKLGRSTTPSGASSPGLNSVTDDGEHDQFCWVCHKGSPQVYCRICPRSFHTSAKCLDGEVKVEDGNCVCQECLLILKAENINHRSEAMKFMNVDQLANMLGFVIERIKSTAGYEPFMNPVLASEAEGYYEMVRNPMYITKLEKNIEERQYGSTEAFLCDFMWIVHNSTIFNSSNSTYTVTAKRLLKVVRQELSEIETCPECYENAHNHEDWFTHVCKRPHVLVWAKLKGFPAWPAKAMRFKDDGMVDVRFFGQHDRAYVQAKDCWYYAPDPPGTKRKENLIAAVDELNVHIEKLKEAYGEVRFGDKRVGIDPSVKFSEHIKQMLPTYVDLDEEEGGGESSNSSGGGDKDKKKSSSSGGGKMKMTISLKSSESPTIVRNSAVEEEEEERGEKDVEAEREEGEANEEEEVEERNEEPMEEEGESSSEESPLVIAEDKVVEHEPEKEDEKMEEEEDELSSEKVLPVPSSKKETNAESSVEKEGARGGEEPDDRVPSGILASALGLRPVSKTNPETPGGGEVPVRKSTRISLASLLNKDEERRDEKQSSSNKAQDFMDQISTQAQTKPGYRFNISKDISISAIGSESGSGSGGAEESSSSLKNNGIGLSSSVKSGLNLRRSINPPPRLVKEGAAPSMQAQIQQMTQMAANKNLQQQRQKGGIISSGQLGQQGQLRSLTRPPVSRVGGVTKESLGSGISVNNPAQSISGAITLPGGTITVTPLNPSGAPSSNPHASFSSSTSVINVNGGTVNGIPVNTAPAQQQRRPKIILPSSVSLQMEKCNQGMGELLKSTVERIAIEIYDSAIANSGKPDPYILQKEKDNLIIKHAKDMADLRRTHELKLKELKMAGESEKRRVLIEAKRQFEQEKSRLLDEAKKKQWCARCLREAQFYCCWNTSYCGYHCQEEHWPLHMKTCSQNKNQLSQGGIGKNSQMV